jgi:hypothetical protein
VRAGLDRPLGTLEIGYQDRHDEVRQRLRVRDELTGVGKLRQQPRGHERADLDLALAGGVRVADPLELPRSGQRTREALQAVAQADFTDDDGAHGAVEGTLC